MAPLSMRRISSGELRCISPPRAVLRGIASFDASLCLLQSHFSSIVCLLLKRGADQDLLDRQHQSPLDAALALANADIVTL